MAEWIPVTAQKPAPDTRVQISYTRHSDYTGKDYKITTCAVYEDGTIPEDCSHYLENEDGWDDAPYDEETDMYYIPEGWYEVLTSTNGEYFCGLAYNEVVTHWMPLPEPPKEV